MAGSRLDKVGSIFARTTGLLRRDVWKIEDKPLWYDVYAMHPPAEEPRYDRPAPNIEVRNIFYEEDLIRVKFHKKVKRGSDLGTVRLDDRQRQSRTQKFIDLYKKYEAQGALDDEKICDVAFEKSLETDWSRPQAQALPMQPKPEPKRQITTEHLSDAFNDLKSQLGRNKSNISFDTLMTDGNQKQNEEKVGEVSLDFDDLITKETANQPETDLENESKKSKDEEPKDGQSK